MKLITFAAASQITKCDPECTLYYVCRLQELDRKREGDMKYSCSGNGYNNSSRLINFLGSSLDYRVQGKYEKPVHLSSIGRFQSIKI